MGNIYIPMSYWLEECTGLHERTLNGLSCPFMIADEWRVLEDCRWTGWVLPCTCTGCCNQGS